LKVNSVHFGFCAWIFQRAIFDLNDVAVRHVTDD
jgi:hypothetical protein